MSTWLARHWEILVVLFALVCGIYYGLIVWAVKKGWLIER